MFVFEMTAKNEGCLKYNGQLHKIERK